METSSFVNLNYRLSAFRNLEILEDVSMIINAWDATWKFLVLEEEQDDQEQYEELDEELDEDQE